MRPSARTIATRKVAHVIGQMFTWEPAIMPHSIGPDRYVLIFEASAACGAAVGGAGGPPSIAPRIFFCRGQITNQTLNHMIVPSSPPSRIHMPRWLMWRSASRISPPRM